MAQLVKRLLHQHENLSLSFQDSHKSQQVRQLLVILPLRRQRPGSVANWPVRLARTGVLWVQNEDIVK